MTRVAIVGAGIGGLSCARRLAEAGLAPVIFDKGRGIGGRVATRRAGDLQFDHGAQYVTAKDDGFASCLRELAEAGAAALWADGRGRARMVGNPGMSYIAKGLAQGLEVQQNAPITHIEPAGEGWRLVAGGAEHHAERVVVTVPAPQVAPLLGEAHPLVRDLRGVRLDPCLTLMAAVSGPAPFVTRRDPDDPLAWIAQDSSKPARPVGTATCWVAQAGLSFSEEHLEDDPAGMVDAMLPLLCDRLGTTQDRVVHAVAHRWRHARVAAPLGQPFLRSPDARLYLAGDWCLGARVEAAWTSGMAAAEDLLGRIA